MTAPNTKMIILYETYSVSLGEGFISLSFNLTVFLSLLPSFLFFRLDKSVCS